MSQDAKNSILLWAGALAVCGVIWVESRLNLLARIPEAWMMTVTGLILAVRVIQEIWIYLRRRRARRREAM